MCGSVKMLSQTGGFSLGKAHASVHSFPTLSTLYHKTIHTNKTINSPINSPVNNSVVPASITLLLSPHTTPQQQHHRERLKQHTQQHNTHKQYNNTTPHKRTCYSHHYSPTTLTTYETMNQLSKCPFASH